MQTIQELADNFYTRHEEHGDGFGHSSNVYNKRLCEQVRQIIEFHVTEALKAASEKAELSWENEIIKNAYQDTTWVDEESILKAYPLENIK